MNVLSSLQLILQNKRRTFCGCTVIFLDKSGLGFYSGLGLFDISVWRSFVRERAFVSGTTPVGFLCSIECSSQLSNPFAFSSFARMVMRYGGQRGRISADEFLSNEIPGPLSGSHDMKRVLFD